ncbi:hypothetical protein HPB49_002941 [Dermacentor silvarum]|uniref:Uncharacterized protein n=1 Tax=Dermacentor silvarum TaxID=543639 RepID=A0ACB8CUZ6_DERSI|nr:hypothetical protein HPB49_002941 [Dermacentor silvarum]
MRTCRVAMSRSVRGNDAVAKNREPDEDINTDRQVDAKSADETPKKPHLQKEDIKIIIRPRDGFNTAKYSVTQIDECILRATGLKTEEGVKDSIRINERQSIVVVSAPTLERAEKYSAIMELRIGDKTYEVTAYMTAPKIHRRESSEGYRTTILPKT